MSIPDAAFTNTDPFATERQNSTSADKPADANDVAVKDNGNLSPPTSPNVHDRRMSREWG
jgi:hypothetical protein